MACRGIRHRRCIALALTSTLLLLVISTGWPMVGRAFVSGTASSCGGGQNITLPSTSASGPRITLAHPTGPIGMWESISGAGWPAISAVIIDLDVPQPNGTFTVALHAIASAKANPSGTISIPGFQVPAPYGCAVGATGDPGTRVDFIASTPDGKLVAKAEFTYTAQPTLSYTGGSHPQPGTAIALLGAQWEANERVTITFTQAPLSQMFTGPGAPPQPLPNGTLHVQADGHGMLSTSYTLPDTLEPRSMVFIQATGNGPLYGTVTVPGLQFIVAPAVPPTIMLDRPSGTVTDAIMVRGARWVPGDTIDIVYCRGDIPAPQTGGPACDLTVSAALATVTVDQRGAFTVKVYLPSSARTGPITIEALVPNDSSGLAAYMQSAAYQIVPPPVPWSRVHPRLAFLLNILRPAIPALALALALLAVYFWRRWRVSRIRAQETAQPTPTPTHA